jgi:predicted HTH transcriptional regulator
MKRYLENLIEQGENLHLDFKFCISDSRKIARTLSAFANTDGGKLLIGVKDNGKIAGIRSEEEIYMVDTAIQLYCRPQVDYSTKQHVTDGKSVLEIEVKKGERKIYQAKDDNNVWRHYFRYGDQNLIANRVLLRVWNREERKAGALVKFDETENLLMEYLKNNKSVTLSKFRKIAGINNRRAEAILVNLILFKIIRINASGTGIIYELNPEIPGPA